MTHPVLTILHPAYVMRGNFGLEPAQVQSLARLRAAMEQGFRFVDTSKPPPAAKLFPTPLDLTAFGRGLQLVAVDIETAGNTILCVGVCEIPTFKLVMVHLHLQYCARAPEYEFNRQWLADVLANDSVSKVFHNGYGFDVPMLEANGFTVRGLGYDTMAMAHMANPEQPKRLSHVGTVYGGIPEWKSLKETDEEEGKG